MKEHRHCKIRTIFLAWKLPHSFCHSCVCQDYRWHPFIEEENTLGVSTPFIAATSASSAPEAYRKCRMSSAGCKVITDCVSARVTTQCQHHISRCLYQCCTIWVWKWDTCICERINADYFTTASSLLLCIHILTLLGCTALLRFSIHLSLSADERQEKHLLPVEVVTYRRDTKRKKMKALMHNNDSEMKWNKNGFTELHKHHFCDGKEAYQKYTHTHT